MSGYMIAEVWCDECGLRVVANDEGTLRDHRADLREDGWERKRNPSGGLTDLCERCANIARSAATHRALAAQQPDPDLSHSGSTGDQP